MTFFSQRKEPSTQSPVLEGRKLPQVSMDRVHLPLKHSILLTLGCPRLSTPQGPRAGPCFARSSGRMAPDQQTPRAVDTSPSSQFDHGARERTADHQEGWCSAQAGHSLVCGRAPGRPPPVHRVLSHNGRLGWGSVMTSELCDAHSPCGQTFPVSIPERQRLLRGK